MSTDFLRPGYLSGIPVENKLCRDRTGDLLKIWQRVLKREDIRVTDNFFELGGDPWMAVELFRDIEKQFGRLLAPLVIYQAPTIASLSAILESPEPPAFPKCVLLRAGTPGPAVFITHGLGGNLMELFSFVKHLEWPHAIYGLQARGTDGLEEPCRSVDEMAQYHLAALRTLGFQGPYLLVGYSFGGVVALEMARHLAEAGETIALLVMIDAYPGLQNATRLQRLIAFGIRCRNYAIKILRPDLRIRTLGIDFTPAMARVTAAAKQALWSYRPRYYHGCIRFVRAKAHLFYPGQEEIWEKFADHFALEFIEGNHLQLVTTYPQNLSVVLSRYLRDLYIPQDHHTDEWSRESR